MLEGKERCKGLVCEQALHKERKLVGKEKEKRRLFFPFTFPSKIFLATQRASSEATETVTSVM